ncbi:MAG: hypothetical protein OWU84_00995 [Firmicutes bacterium]|nr:hypothetical protein [Bacillota bacterium]
MEPLNLMLLSGDYAKIHAAAMVTLVASSLGRPVNIFVSMDALAGFHQSLDERASLLKSPVAEAIQSTGGADYLLLFQQAKEVGDVHVYACSLVADLKQWELADLAPVFDDMMGIAGFLGKVENGTTLTF